MLANQWGQACKCIGVCPISFEQFRPQALNQYPNTHLLEKGEREKPYWDRHTPTKPRKAYDKQTEWSQQSPTRIIEVQWEGKMRE